jgi:uncharacterized protein involved in response to NO
MTTSSKQSVLLSYGFRPLFLLVVLQALGMMLLWLLWWTGFLPINVSGNPVYWHAHEMLNGMAGAAIGGFLLTAVATWTKRPPVSGLPLLLLCLVWLGGRVGGYFPTVGAVCDFAYWSGLLGLMANEVLRAGNTRNYKVLLVLSALLLSDLAYHVLPSLYPGTERQTVWAQLWLVVIMINLVGGRIIPAFTRNWLKRQNEQSGTVSQALPAEFGAPDLLANISVALFAISTLLPVPVWWILLCGTVTTLLLFWRLVRWQGHRTLRDPLVWMLHLGFAWIPVGVALLAFGLAGYIPVSAGIHALTVGAIATMIVAVSSRAALGHTGRPLHSHRLLTFSIVLLTLAAVVRVCAAIGNHGMLVSAAGVLWIAAFLCYAVVYVPVLLLPARKP